MSEQEKNAIEKMETLIKKVQGKIEEIELIIETGKKEKGKRFNNESKQLTKQIRLLQWVLIQT